MENILIASPNSTVTQRLAFSHSASFNRNLSSSLSIGLILFFMLISLLGFYTSVFNFLSYTFIYLYLLVYTSSPLSRIKARLKSTFKASATSSKSLIVKDSRFIFEINIGPSTTKSVYKKSKDSRAAISSLLRG